VDALLLDVYGWVELSSLLRMFDTILRTVPTISYTFAENDGKTVFLLHSNAHTMLRRLWTHNRKRSRDCLLYRKRTRTVFYLYDKI